MNVEKYSKAFTLIELLVVLGIIALLLSILIPALDRARGAAVKIQCSSNLRQMYIPHFTYNNEYNAFLPISVNDERYPTIINTLPWFTSDYFRRGLSFERLPIEDKLRRLEQQEYKPSYPKKFICPAAKYALEHSEDNLIPDGQKLRIECPSILF